MSRRPKGSGSIYILKDGTVIGQYEIQAVNGKSESISVEVARRTWLPN